MSQIAEELRYDEKEVKLALKELASKGKIKMESAKDKILEIIE